MVPSAVLTAFAMHTNAVVDPGNQLEFKLEGAASDLKASEGPTLSVMKPLVTFPTEGWSY